MKVKSTIQIVAPEVAVKYEIGTLLIDNLNCVIMIIDNDITHLLGIVLHQGNGSTIRLLKLLYGKINIRTKIKNCKF